MLQTCPATFAWVTCSVLSLSWRSPCGSSEDLSEKVYESVSHSTHVQTSCGPHTHTHSHVLYFEINTTTVSQRGCADKPSAAQIHGLICVLVSLQVIIEPHKVNRELRLGWYVLGNLPLVSQRIMSRPLICRSNELRYVLEKALNRVQADVIKNWTLLETYGHLPKFKWLYNGI